MRSLGSSVKLPRSASALLDTDPLHYGDITLDHQEDVKLDAGEHVIKKLNVLGGYSVALRVSCKNEILYVHVNLGKQVQSQYIEFLR